MTWVVMIVVVVIVRGVRMVVPAMLGPARAGVAMVVPVRRALMLMGVVRVIVRVLHRIASCRSGCVDYAPGGFGAWWTVSVQ